MSKSKLLFSALVGVFVLMQLVPVNRSAPEDVGPLQIADAQVAEIFDRACADCHTNQTDWPWYGYVAPASWFLAKHIDEGREHFNISRWEDQSDRRKATKLREMAEEVAEGEMPLPSYLIIHGEAKLTEDEKSVLIAWAEEMEQGVRGASRRSAPGGEGEDEGEVGDDAEAGDDAASSAEATRTSARATHQALRSMIATAGLRPFELSRRAERATGTADVSFSEDIMPIFEATCLECHGAADSEGEIVLEAQLDLRTWEAVMAGSEFGSVIEPGNPEESYLLESVEMGDMPEDGDPLSPEQVDLIRQWIIAGAPNN